MSKKPSKIEIYSLADFQKANRLDRIRMHMLEPERFVLSDDDGEYYRQLQHAYHMVFDELRESVAMKAIMENVPGANTWHRANKVLRDIYELFSPFLKKNKDLRRAIVLEKLYMLADVAQKRAVFTYTDYKGDQQEGADREWMEMAERLLTQAAKIEGLDQPEKAAFDPEELLIPEIEITSDPAAFLASQMEFEDAEFDDYPDGEAGEDEGE